MEPKMVGDTPYDEWAWHKNHDLRWRDEDRIELFRRWTIPHALISYNPNTIGNLGSTGDSFDLPANWTFI